MTNSSPFFNTRAPALGQNGTAFSTRQKPAANIDPTNASSQYPVDSADTTGLYGAISAGPGIYRSNSSDSTFANFPQARQGSIGSRQPETESNALSIPFGDTSQYSFNQKPPTHGEFHSQRPSVNGHSVSFSTEAANRSRVPAYSSKVTDKDFADSFSRVLSLDETADSVINGFQTNGFNPASQPFQFIPNSSSWLQDPLPGNYGAQDNFLDQMPPPYLPKRGSSGGGSPGGNGNTFRPNLNGPRAFGNAPNPRAEPWSKAVPREPRMFHEYERQPHPPQYLPPPPPPPYHSQFYNPGVPQFPHYDPSFEHNHFRPGGIMFPYVPPMHPPFRPSKDNDIGKGIRSALLEEFRSAGKQKRFELKVCLCYTCSRTRCSLYLGPLWASGRVQRRSTWFTIYPGQAPDSKQRREGTGVPRNRAQWASADEGRLRELRHSKVL